MGRVPPQRRCLLQPVAVALRATEPERSEPPIPKKTNPDTALGSVNLDHGKVQYVYGGKGMPPAPALFDEADLPQGTTVQAEFVYAGKTTLSPIFTP